MAVNLSELLAGSTTDETLATLVALAAVAGFPAYAWQSGTVPRTFFELESVSYADLTQVIGAIASGGFVDYAEGPWLTLRAAQGYNVQRQPAVSTQGTIRLTDAGAIGPVVIATVGQVVIESGDSRYRNATLGTLPLSGTLDLTFEAETPGAAANVPDGSSFELVTSLPGVTAEQVTPPGGTWITQQGADEESDTALRARCKARWGELGYGATEAAYRYWAATASAEVTRVAVAEAPADGTVAVYVAGTAGAISAPGLAAVQAYIEARRPQCVQPTAYNASQVAISLAGTATVVAAQLAAAQAAVQAAIVAHLALLPIGGTVYRAQLEVVIMQAHPGMVNVALDLAPVTLLLANEVPISGAFSALTWNTV